MTTETKMEDTAAFKWMQVREAITQRWSHIDRDALADVPNDQAKLTAFVKENVDARDEEVESVVGEFAPNESYLDRVSHATGDTLHRASESTQFAVMRADECIARRPTESVLTSFLAGIVIGATVTAMFMQTKPEPSAWDRIKDRRWS